MKLSTLKKTIEKEGFLVESSMVKLDDNNFLKFHCNKDSNEVSYCGRENRFWNGIEFETQYFDFKTIKEVIEVLQRYKKDKKDMKDFINWLCK